jgi:shikimate dehydrogenase
VPPSPDGERELRNLLRELRQGIWDGFNLTVPHKRSILPYLDGLSSVARAVGAVNTIYQEGTQLIGENTDVTGFQTDLKRWLDRFAGAKPRRKFSLQFASYDWPIRIQAIPLKAAFLSGFEPCGLVVNATPAGMFPDCDVSPWPPDLEFSNGIALYDLVYNPAETALVRAARRKGFPATNGLGMLVEQAALAFEGWTGKPAPRGFMRLAAERALGEFQVQKSPSSRPERNRRR